MIKPRGLRPTRYHDLFLGADQKVAGVIVPLLLALALPAHGGDAPAADAREEAKLSILDQPNAMESGTQADAPARVVSSTTPQKNQTAAKQVQPRKLKRRTAVGGVADTELAPMPWYRTGLGSLGVVLAILAGLYFVVRRWVPSVRATEPGILRVVGRTPITPKHHVALVQLGSRFIAVGVSPDGMNTLCEVNDPAEVAELAARVASPPGRRGADFNALLAREHAEYSAGIDDAMEPTTPVPERANGHGRPLKALLHRLNRLRSA